MLQIGKGPGWEQALAQDHAKSLELATDSPGFPQAGSEDPGRGRPHPAAPPPGTASSNPAGVVSSLQGLVASNLNLKPGECLRVRGEVAPEAKR